MHVSATIDDLKQQVAALRAAGRRIAFVPTMGNLHAGHEHLMQQAHLVLGTERPLHHPAFGNLQLQTVGRQACGLQRGCNSGL